MAIKWQQGGGGRVVTKREEKVGKCILERRKVESKNSAI